MILEGRTTDAIDKTKELFPTLLNDKNLLFVLKVRQFIEMVNGTESEIRSTTRPSTSSPATANHLLASAKTRALSPSCASKKTTSRSRSNSPYTSDRAAQPHSNGSTCSPARQTPGKEPCAAVAGSSEANHLPLSNTNSNAVVNLMDVDENPHSNATSITNGFSSHGTVTRPSPPSTTNQISNGHTPADNDSTNSNGCSTKATDTLDGMEHDGCVDAAHTMDTDAGTCPDVQTKSIGNSNDDDQQLLVQILQFGRELHALKQQLAAEHGDNQHNDKILQVRTSHALASKLCFGGLQDAFSLLAYSDPKCSPLAHLLEPSQRETVSGAVNSAILGMHTGAFFPSHVVLLLQRRTTCRAIRRSKCSLVTCTNATSSCTRTTCPTVPSST